MRILVQMFGSVAGIRDNITMFSKFPREEVDQASIIAIYYFMKEVNLGQTLLALILVHFGPLKTMALPARYEQRVSLNSKAA